MHQLHYTQEKYTKPHYVQPQPNPSPQNQFNQKQYQQQGGFCRGFRGGQGGGFGRGGGQYQGPVECYNCGGVGHYHGYFLNF